MRQKQIEMYFKRLDGQQSQTLQQTNKPIALGRTTTGLGSGEGTQLLDVAGATAAKATFFLPKKMASELTPNELKME